MKSNTLSDVTNELETLASHVNDSVKGYEAAAEKTSDQFEAFRTMLESRAIERRFHANAINERLKCIGQDEETSGSLKGAAHRALISVKDLFSGSADIEKITEESLRGERALLDYINDTFHQTEVLDGATIDVLGELESHVKTCILDLETKY